MLAHGVAQRAHEIAIRLALGTGRRQVVAMVTRQAATLAGAGLVIGLGIAAAASRVLQDIVVGVSLGDAATYAGVAAGVLVMALAASYLPARRAARVDPVRAMRS